MPPKSVQEIELRPLDEQLKPFWHLSSSWPDGKGWDYFKYDPVYRDKLMSQES